MVGVRGALKAPLPPYGPHQGLLTRGLLHGLLSLGHSGRFHLITSSQELTMADLAFVVTTVAIFALVGLIARGVAKL